MEREVTRRKRNRNGKQKKIRVYVIPAVCVIVISIVCILLFVQNSEERKKKAGEHYISKALAARMLVLLKTDSPSETENDNSLRWYVKYMDYLYENGDIRWKLPDDSIADSVTGYSRSENANLAFSYGELQEYLMANGWNMQDIGEYTGIDIWKTKSGKKVKKDDFYKIYDYLVLKNGNAGGVVRRELTIIGTPANMTSKQIREYGKWNCVAIEGVFCFEGLSVDAYCDRTICVYARGNQIISVLTEVSDTICYPNSYIVSAGENVLEAYIYGMYREFKVGRLPDKLTDIIGDIYMENGEIKNVTFKKDTIRGKVLKVGNDGIEIAGYGTIGFADNFKVYKNYGEFEEKGIKDIVVGYELSDFVVADGKICAAVINKELIADDIRVLIMDTGFTSIFHNRVTITSEDGFTVKRGDRDIHVEPGKLIDVYYGSEWMSQGRIVIEPDGINNSVTLLSVERSYGNPHYSGRIEISYEQDKLVVINELPLEEYLYYVVPSEMPTGFGVEALKVQAVCARSYAYKHLTDNSYRMYGAHVDDSVNFQVYNNIEAQPDSTQAVKETYGQVISKYGSVVAAYYYSTSCGVMSDISLWGGEGKQYDVYKTKTVNPQGKYVNLSDEADFKKYIYGKNEDDFDYEFKFYRWDVELGTDYLTSRINEYLPIRYGVEPANILTMDEDGSYVSSDNPNVGRLLSLEVAQRCSSGAIRQLIIHGTEGTVLVKGELNIRYILGPGDNMINTNDDGQTVFYILPSAYMYPEEILEDGEIVGYRFTGGGYGHGIGMSQNAVSSMVKRGMRYDDIIEFFYENVDIVNIYHG